MAIAKIPTAKTNRQLFKTRSGYTLHLRHIPTTPIELALNKVNAELRSQGVVLDPPGFHIAPELPNGTKGDAQWFAYTEATLDVPGEPKMSAENHARWAAYKAGQQMQANAQGTKRIELYLRFGVEVEGGIPGIPEPEDAEQFIADYQAGRNDGEWMDDPAYWQAVDRMLGSELPTEALDLKVRWLTERCLADDELAELVGAMISMQAEGSLTAEDLDSFRTAIRTQVTDGIRARFVTAFAPAERPVDTQSDG